MLDSHVFVSRHEEPEKLSRTAADEIVDPANEIFLSVASVWELQIKIKLGKFNFSEQLNKVIEQQIANDLQILPVELPHALYLENLELHHKDPFDRLLIAQAKVENLSLVTADKQFVSYEVDILW
ncbi:MAG: type II toxin-antitoxin system VapC family toxin [Pyrinomonadaceae bacterium]